MIITEGTDQQASTLRELNSNAIEISSDVFAPLHCSSFWTIPDVFALKLDDMADIESFIRENIHAALTKINGLYNHPDSLTQ